MKCGYCGKPKEEHENGHVTTTERNVKVQSGVVSALKSSVTFVGDCWKDARNNDNWEV